MGTSRQSNVQPAVSSGVAGALFTPVQQRVLGLLFGQPGRRFQSGELIRLAASGTGGVHRQLTKLAGAGLVSTERVGNQKYYQANLASPVFEELRSLIAKTAGLAQPIATALEPLRDRIRAAFVYGSIAKGSDTAASDIDLMVIADDLKYSDVILALLKAESVLGRPVNPNVMSAEDWTRKRRQSGFVARIAGQPRIFVIGTDDDLG